VTNTDQPIPLSPQLAIDNFLSVWLLSQPMGDIAGSLTCIEAEALADLFYAFGHNVDEYNEIVDAHAESDECGDKHCQCGECDNEEGEE
jgi:hypothetical protein